MALHVRKYRNKTTTKNGNTNLVIAAPKKEGLTSNKSATQRKNDHRKGKQTIAKEMCKKVCNLLIQRRSKPGQWRQQHFCGHVTAVQIFFKIKKSVMWLAHPGVCIGQCQF